MEFPEFVSTHSRDLLRTAWLLTGDWAAAEDLVQTSLLQSWRRWPSVSAPLAYVRTAMARQFVSTQRRRWHGELPTEVVPELPGPDEFGPAELRTAVATALAVLSGRERAVVVLRYYADLSEAETAQLLGIARGTVKRYAADALTKLRAAPTLSGLLTEEAPR